MVMVSAAETQVSYPAAVLHTSALLLVASLILLLLLSGCKA